MSFIQDLSYPHKLLKWRGGTDVVISKNSTVVRGVKGRWGAKGQLQNDSYQAMYMHHDNVVDYLEKYDIYDCLSNFC